MKNYHTHTYRCQHATGDVFDYAETAIKAGITVLGMSDHTPLPDNRWPEVRMGMHDLSSYVAAIDDAKCSFENLKILKGMECEYAEEYAGFYKDELKGKLGFDYLILGAHSYVHNGTWHPTYGGVTDKAELTSYAEYLVKSMNSKLFDFVAHPDLFGNSYQLWDAHTKSCSKYILEAAQELKIPLEINGYGLRKPKINTSQGTRPMYPWNPFWELAAYYDILVIVNSDAHKPQDICANMDEGLEIATRYKLQVADLSYIECR